MNPRILFSIIIIAVIASWEPSAAMSAELTAQERYQTSLVKTESDDVDSSAPTAEVSEVNSENVLVDEKTPPTPVPSSKAVQSKDKISPEESKSGWFPNLLSHRHKTDFEELEDNYQKALRYYNRRKMDKAQKAFEKIERQYPDYKDTRRLLTVIQEEAENKKKMVSDDKYRQDIQQEEMKKEQWRKEAEVKVKDDQLMLETQAEQTYRDARVLYDRRRFEEAREKFEYVDTIIPGYRQTAAFLKSIEQKIADAVVHESFEKEIVKKQEKPRPIIITDIPPVETQAVVAAVEEPVEDVSSPVESEDSFVKEENVSAEQDIQKEEVRPQTSIALEPVILKEEQSSAEPLYAQALSLFNSEKYDEAERKFWDVQVIDPQYKAVATYLKKIEEARKEDEVRAFDEQARLFANQLRAEHLAEKIRNDKDKHISKQMVKAQRKELENLHRLAKKDYNRKDYSAAKEKFERISAMHPGYDSVDRYLEKIDAMTAPAPVLVEKKRLKVPLPDTASVAQYDTEIQDAVMRRKEQLVTVTEDKYSQALAFYKNKRYTDAKYKFIEVEAMSPNYRETRSYLAHLDEDATQSSVDFVEIPEKSAKSAKVKKSTQMEKAKSDVVSDAEWVDSSKKKSSGLSRLFGSKDAKKEKQSQKSETNVDDAKLEEAYQSAIAAYGRGNYLSAQEQFKNLLEVRKGYKDSENYMRLATKMANKKEKERLEDARKLAKQHKAFKEAVAQKEELMDQNQQAEAGEETSAVVQSSTEKSSRLSRWFGKKKEEKPVVQQVAVDQSSEEKAEKAPAVSQETSVSSQVDPVKVEAVYQEGIALYDQGNYLSAQDRFSSITELLPDYKSAAEYLKKSKMMVAAKEKERLKGSKQLAKHTKSVADPAEDQAKSEQKSVLKRMKFWKKSSEDAGDEKETEAITPTSQDSAKEEKNIAKLKQDIAEREAQDADRIAKLERRHKREQAENEGLPSTDERRTKKKKSGNLVAKVFDRQERDATLDQRRKDLEKMVTERRKVLQSERSKIQKEFEKSLDDLYVKAVKMNDAGLTQQAYKMFIEIDRLQPDYKDTQKYLSRMTQAYSQSAPMAVSSQESTRNPQYEAAPSGARDEIISSVLDKFEKGM